MKRKEFEQRIYINDVNPSNATVVEMRIEAHYKVERQEVLSCRLKLVIWGLMTEEILFQCLKECIEDFKQIREV